MNGRELLTATLQGKRTDRVAVSPFIAPNNIYEMFQLHPGDRHIFDPPDFDLAEKFVAYHDHFGFEVLSPRGHNGDSYVPSSAENWEVSVTREGGPRQQHRITTVRTPAGELRQIMNFERSSPHMIVLAVEKYLIETHQDFEISPSTFPGAVHESRHGTPCRKAVGDKGLVNPCTHGAFNTICAIPQT